MDNPNKHTLVPKHTKVSDSEKKKLLEKFNITERGLPKIKSEDPAIAKLGVKEGDIVKVERISSTAGIAYYYRAVAE
jgi:DNA-directed RNA polymerase subunit H (RpoH/RPB5)